MPRAKLIAIDIDGTLIDSKTHLKPEVIEAVLRAGNDGAHVTLATGRMVSAAKQYIDTLGIELPLVALNGAFVGWSGNCREPIYNEPVSPVSSRAICKAAWDTDCSLLYVSRDTAFGRNINEITSPALSTWIDNISPLESIDSLEVMEPSLILIAGDKDETANLDRLIKGLGLEDTEHFFFPSMRFYPMHYLEIRALGTNKGKGLLKLAEFLDIRPEEILAIGDYINDVPMAEVVGAFAAPASAREEVKAIADYVSPFSNDEGAVAEILETLYFSVG